MQPNITFFTAVKALHVSGGSPPIIRSSKIDDELGNHLKHVEL
jgi:hypothetical protein